MSCHVPSTTYSYRSFQSRILAMLINVPYWQCENDFYQDVLISPLVLVSTHSLNSHMHSLPLQELNLHAVSSQAMPIPSFSHRSSLGQLQELYPVLQLVQRGN